LVFLLPFFAFPPFFQGPNPIFYFTLKRAPGLYFASPLLGRLDDSMDMGRRLGGYHHLLGEIRPDGGEAYLV
jgi:hypothetical protein